ncbi:MAG TPA: MerR family transcriptional regulator [Gemmatimonadaceae bacterium]|nr:MerR family transcriptional regulator [Gemmatimonadaceae bacterium]
MSPDLDLAQLCDAADVTPRTVRYYIQQGLLPAPETRGPGAHYHEGHLARLRLIKRLQREHFPLGEIRRQLGTLSDEQVGQLVNAAPARRDPTALGYIREVLAAGSPRLSTAAMRVSLSRSSRESAPPPPTRSNWERVSLTPDIELHLRRPLTREQNRSVERLLEFARELFAEEKL